MLLRMTVVDPSEPRAGQDVLIEAPGPGADGMETPAATFAQIRPQLAALLAGQPEHFAVDGVVVKDADVLGEGRLLRGAILTAQRPLPSAGALDRMPLGSGALLALHVVGGPGAGRVIPVRRGDHVVGRAVSASVRLDDLGVSRAHATMCVDDTGIQLRDLDPTNVTTIEGSQLPSDGAKVAAGDRIRMGSTTLMLRRLETTPAAAEHRGGVVHINRPPRFTSDDRPTSIVFPAAPRRPEGARAPILAAFVPLVLSIALALVLTSPAVLLFALISPVLLLSQWWGDRRHGRVSHRAKLAEHAARTEELESQLAAALRDEARARHAAHPDLAVVASVARARDARLWERSPGDTDDLVLRVGTGDRPAQTTVERRSDSFAGEGDQASSANFSPAMMRGVPIVVDLGRHSVLGIAGPRPRALAVAASLIAQLSVWHSPRSTRIVVLTAAADPSADWSWASHLPHVLRDGSTAMAAVASTDDEDTVAARVRELEAVIAARSDGDRPAAGSPVACVPRIVLVLDGAHELRARPGIAAVLAAAPTVGIHVLAIDTAAERLPAESRAQFLITDGPSPRGVLHEPGVVVDGIVPDLPSRPWFESIARWLAPLEDATPDPGAAAALPAAIGLKEAHESTGADPTMAEGLARSWARSDGRPTAVLGLSRNGPLILDLAQDGPHCLVGGTTGSGKSELLQTLVAGLAVHASPQDLSFVLVDYKGGSAFQECASLPHTLGLVTDLDEHLTTRALVSLGAELKRREALLALVGAKDLDDYRRCRTSDPSLPSVARLVLVVDEFKMLADELPDFVAGLVRIAAVGRSLGIHLVLATQRPAGIITGDMRANVSLRIALRVRDRADSDDVIESPVAAQISDRLPGRAWVRSANGDLLEVQTAYAGADLPAVASVLPADARVVPLSWSDLGRPVAQISRDCASGRAATAERSGRTQLQALVMAAREAAQELALTPVESPWLPPLPETLRARDLPPPRRRDAAALGLCDEPTQQAQSTWSWHPADDGHLGVAGGARSGRTSALRTLALGLAGRWAPTQLHLHLIEGTPGSLADLAALPHLGSVTSTADPHLAARVLVRLTEQVALRNGGPLGTSGAASASAPTTVLLVDGWEAVEEAFEGIDHGVPTEALLRLARDGLAAGIRLVVTGGRAIVTGRLTSVLQRRLVLPMPDPLDLTLAGLTPDESQGHRTTGRAIDLITRQHVQLAHVGHDPGIAAQRTAVAELASVLTAGAVTSTTGTGATGTGTTGTGTTGTDKALLPWRVQPLPTSVAWDLVPPATHDVVPLGLGGDDARPMGLGAGRARRAVIIGPPRSGRTTALVVVALQLAGQGVQTALVATRRTWPDQLRGVPNLHLLPASDGDLLRRLRQTHPVLSVLVDDAEGLDGTATEPVLLEALAESDRTGAWCVASVDSRRAVSLYRGLVPELARHGAGVVLSPTSPTDGDLLGVRVEPVRHRLPGRGVLVAEGEAIPLQLADPSGHGLFT